MPEQYTIGTPAKQAGVNVETIRYYQRRGLVGEPDRPLGSIRRHWKTIARRQSCRRSNCGCDADLWLRA